MNSSRLHTDNHDDRETLDSLEEKLAQLRKRQKDSCVAAHIITTLHLYNSLEKATLVSIVLHHLPDATTVQVMRVINELHEKKEIDVADSVYSYVPPKESAERSKDAIALERQIDDALSKFRAKIGWRRRFIIWLHRVVDGIGRFIMRRWQAAFAFALFTGIACGLLLPTRAHGEDMPAWVLPGLLARESSSMYRDDKSINYVDRSVGDAGELGPFQMTAAAFADVALPGEQFQRLATDTVFAEQVAIRKLNQLYKSEGDWFHAVGRWNTGGRSRYAIAWRYAKDVQRRGRELIAQQ